MKCNGINAVDASGVYMLFNLVERFKSNGITLGFSGPKKQVREVMDSTGLSQAIGLENIFATDREALARLGVRGKVEAQQPAYSLA